MSRSSIPVALACMTLLYHSGEARAERFTGSASANGKTCPADGTADVKFLYDTGASQTFISRKCATALGLLKADGTPNGNNGEKRFSGNIDTWCFDNVTVDAKDSGGNNCSIKTTVYVTKNSGDNADDNILGTPWRKAAKGAVQEDPAKYIWPGKVEPLKKLCELSIDPATGYEQMVLPGIHLNGAGGSSTLDMIFLNDSNYSFVPLSVAQGLGSISGSVDLAALDPELLSRLDVAGLNDTQQTVFQTVTIDSFDIGFGLVTDPVTLLVSNDGNSGFGILGDDLFRSNGPSLFFLETEDTSGLGQIPEPGSIVLMTSATLLVGGFVARSRRSR